jgi:hypothetical protein
MSKSWLANTTPPTPSELPSKPALIIASVLVALVSVLIVLTTVLPAERGVDPTGLGKVTGLQEMGEFKVEAAKEFAAIEAMIRARQAADSASAAADAPPSVR